LDAVLYPSNDSLAPRVSQTNRQYNDEKENFKEAKDTQFFKNDRPGDDKDNIYIKSDKEQGKDVEAKRVLHPRRAYWGLTGFISLKFLFGSTMRSDQVRHGRRQYDEYKTGGKQDARV
jgi:hypothetical protein